MKTLSFLLLMILSGILFSCTPTDISDTDQSRNILSTGDDDSVRPDNDRD
ncbi:hypothetical protein QRD02_13475 [Aequorivita sp. SDUM287046]|uniref:Uncharacterized protein n=1 Tax=Aequorivita aurantiaca TaxID=3053356 RepID=A0ABT8DQ74_9FLAO|nr:hypothetical protein [Aequorivita aurantiaca]MDN3725393.1 hypothetical protein [Aequorivita aurantiaca]